MTEAFSEMLATGKPNSLGRVNEVIEIVLKDKSRLEELYLCLFEGDAWLRMRAADALEKVCREHPEWIEPYIDRFEDELHSSEQPSIRWHLAQIYQQVSLTDSQKKTVINWLKELISTKDVDWIVAANTMDTLAQFVGDGSLTKNEMVKLLNIQLHHKSPAVVRRANKCLVELAAG